MGVRGGVRGRMGAREKECDGGSMRDGGAPGSPMPPRAPVALITKGPSVVTLRERGGESEGGGRESEEGGRLM